MTIERITDRNIAPQPRIDTTKQTPPIAANQFESVFLQSLLKSNCIDQHFTGEHIPCITPTENQLPHAVNTDIKSPEIIPMAPEIKQPTIGHSVDDFVKSIWPYAKQASNLIGLDPKILMAQAALETGWGQFIAKDMDGSSSHNLFNIKAKSADPSVNIKTTEYITNTPVKMMASFKKYPSIEHSFNDYIALIKGDRYQTALANTHDPERYVDALYQAGYATDPDYAHKILAIYHGDELQQALNRSGCQI